MYRGNDEFTKEQIVLKHTNPFIDNNNNVTNRRNAYINASVIQITCTAAMANILPAVISGHRNFV